MKFSFFLVIISFYSCRTFAQTTLSDTSFVNVSISNSIKAYERFIEGQQLYFNGSAYVEPERTNEEHSFFMTDDWTTGSVTFEGQHFTNVPLLYDIAQDQLITESATGNMQVLAQERVSGFSLGTLPFEKIENEKVANSLPGTGYFQVLYPGKTKLICLRQKSMQEKIDGNKIEVYFDEKSRYFVLLNGKYFPVKSRRSLLKLLPEHRNELRAFANRNRLNYNNNLDLTLAGMVTQYDALKGG
jgi:hypothetical protein